MTEEEADKVRGGHEYRISETKTTAVFDAIQNITFSYNREEFFIAESEHRKPSYRPKFSAHILRRTFCTRMCENESNIKAVQDVMGHKSSRTAMDVYNEATIVKKFESFKSIEGKIKLHSFTPLHK